MMPKIRSGYLYLLLGASAVILIFTVNSRNKIITNYYNDTETDGPLEVPSILGIINCSDVPLEKSVQQRGNFVVLQNYIMADRQFKCEESITLTSPGDYRFLDNIIPLVDRWQGPISVALYSPGHDFFTTMQCIAYLRICTTHLVREYVTFHLFFENEHFPKNDYPLIDIYEDTYDCSEPPPYETMKDEEMYKEKHSLTYPINVARNIAKINAQTYFAFPSDIELYPTRDFIAKFFYFVRDNPEYIHRKKNNVFVLPIFEIVSDQKVPENKTQLQGMFKRNRAFLFHRTVCASCHRVPDGDKWLEAKETEGLNVFSVGKREGKFAVWEPFFVCTQKEPLWDERLNWEGQGNKMCQVYSMCMLNYDFMVLDNAFLIHKPGIKKKKVQVTKHMDQTKKNNKILLKIQGELEKIYGKNKNCKVH